MQFIAIVLSVMAGFVGLAEQGEAEGLKAYRAELESLTRDEGWWWASNADYMEADGEQAPDAYGIRYWLEAGGVSAGGCLWSIRDGEPTAVHWNFYQGWDAARGRPFSYQSHTSGTLTGLGYLVDREGTTTVMEQEFRSVEGGDVDRIRHRSEWPDADTHVTQSSTRVDEKWMPRRTYTWNRRTSGPTPCGPVR